MSILDVVNSCDNVLLKRDEKGLYDAAHADHERLVPLYLSNSHTSSIIGLLRPVIVEQLKVENERSRKNGLPESWLLNLDVSEVLRHVNRLPGPYASFQGHLNTPSKRTATMKEIGERWRDMGLFADVCGPKQWRDEMYPVYADPFGTRDYPGVQGAELELNYAFEMERSVCPLFGLVTYGVHLSIYEEAVETENRLLHLWVPKRSLHKPTFPGFLDNTVAGGVSSGISVFDVLIKECMEEASIKADIVRQHCHLIGEISYFSRNIDGWLLPEVEYIYGMAIPPHVDPGPFTPCPLDGEVESFELLTHEHVMKKLRAGLFKPNCGLAIIYLLIQLGYITPENEPDYLQITNRLHDTFDYANVTYNSMQS